VSIPGAARTSSGAPTHWVFTARGVVEQILGSSATLAPIELLTYAAAVTERVRHGAAVLLTALRTPVHTAKSLAPLDQLSGGRHGLRQIE
jgi:alkanesulfonate monooxygenase SsuD/methylene tetrahydromethanopterin reductase-like flavin-dependent oxidoreductase (luciferase family)